MIYLDWNAAAPLSGSAKKSIQEYLVLQGPLNPSSQHYFGKKSLKILETAREKILSFLGSVNHQVVFTSSATEANQLVVLGCLESALKKNKKFFWLTSPMEHTGLLSVVDIIYQKGGEVIFLPVTASGAVAGDYDLLRKYPISLVSLMWVNNETGIINDIDGWSKAAQEVGAYFHTDAVQALGKINWNLDFSYIDYLTLSGYKIGAPAGIGALIKKTSSPLEPRIFGLQEKGQRGGAVNLLGAHCLANCITDLKIENPFLQDKFETLLQNSIENIHIHGQAMPRVWNTTNFTLLDRIIKPNDLIQQLDLSGFCISSGSACGSGIQKPSHVLTAMGLSLQQSFASLRVSYGATTQNDELEQFVYTLREIDLKYAHIWRQQ